MLSIPPAMKTPERWRPLPRLALFVNVFAERCHGVTLWRHGLTSRDVVTSWCDVVTFFNLVTLTFELIKIEGGGRGYKKSSGSLNFSKNIVSLVHHGAYCALVVHIAPSWCTSTPYTVVVVYNVPWVNPHTHTHTHRRDRLYTLDRWRGREKQTFHNDKIITNQMFFLWFPCQCILFGVKCNQRLSFS